eukprot:gb/GEZN01011065.1/.p1 GENE.gb/GEZN01011065.1/~~gb/GEZN01011065.1/.p1  ORF type:complete len:264 (-),score=40.08 gb/GEZN01011065.1/:304-1095(-)
MLRPLSRQVLVQGHSSMLTRVSATGSLQYHAGRMFSSTENTASTEKTAYTPWTFKGPTKRIVKKDFCAKRFGTKHNKKHSTWWIYKIGPDKMRKRRARTMQGLDRPQVITTEEWKKIKNPPQKNNADTIMPTLQEKKEFPRPVKNKYLIKLLKREEQEKIESKWPRHIEPFKTGDKIWIYMRVGLHTEGQEIQKGTVISMRGKGNYDSNFTILNWIGRSTYEMQFPLWMPQIKKIINVEKYEKRRRRKMEEIKKWNPALYQVL